MVRIVVVDDHQIFIDGLKELIEHMPTAKVVAEANDGIDLIDVLDKVQADLILMDVNMPRMDGLEATKKVKDDHTDCKIIILSMHDSFNQIQKLLKAGADGYILKNTGKEELEEAIHIVAGGESYFSKQVTSEIMKGMQSRTKVQNEIGTSELTERELDVLRLIVEEYTTKEIAEELSLSHHTVESHRKNLIAKLRVKNVAGLVRYAIESGIIDK